MDPVEPFRIPCTLGGGDLENLAEGGRPLGNDVPGPGSMREGIFGKGQLGGGATGGPIDSPGKLFRCDITDVEKDEGVKVDNTGSFW